MTENDTIRFIAENWEVCFLYGLKILSDIRKEIHAHKTDIEVIKYAVGIDDRRRKQDNAE